MSPDRLAHLELLRVQLAARTRLCEVLAAVLPADAPNRTLLNRLRELGEDHIAFGSALRRFADATDLEGDTCAV